MERALELLNGLRECAFGPGAAREDVASLELEMKHALPADYVEYLVELGCGLASSEDFFGLGGAPHLDASSARRRLREGPSSSRLPEHLIPVRPDGYGNFDCIDLARSTAERSTIVFWRHDRESESQVIGLGFWEWFSDQLELLRDFDAEGD
jgi:cell wall assembly regulator SMI1